MKYTLLSLAILGVTAVSAQNFSPNISNGKMPSTMTAKDLDGIAVPTTCYKNGKTDAGWTVSSVGTTGYAFISPSHTHESTPQNNRLSTNQLTIDENALISWKARSVHPDFPDTYQVVIKLDGSSEDIVLFEGEAEEVFTPHCVSIEEYAGKKAEIAFVCNSTDGYILAVSDIFVGVPAEPLVFIQDNTRKFVAETDSIDIFGTLSNTGATTSISRISLTVGDKEVVSRQSGIKFVSGQELPFSLKLPVTLNECTNYTIKIHGPEDEVLASASGSAMASWFARTHFVDEGTGMWCNNCPDGALALRKLERLYPHQLAIASTHVDDFVSNYDYWPDLKFYAVPYMMMDRVESTKNSGSGYFHNALWKPTTIELTITNNEYELGVVLRSSEDLDNKTDRYRLGYVITADFYQSENSSDCYQKNNLTYPNREEYYFLPSIIASHLVKFHDINVGGEGYFKGLPKSIPSKVNSWEPTECMYLTPDIPFDEGWSNQKAHVYVLDTQSGEIMNCATIPFDGSIDSVVSKVEGVQTESPLKLRVRDDQILLTGSRSAELEIMNLSGAVVWKGQTDGKIIVPESAKGMPVIIRAISADGTAVLKAIL